MTIDAIKEPVLIENPLPNVLLVRIHRPEAKNALNQDVRDGIQGAFNSLNANIRCVIIAGGEDFAAGADIRDMVEKRPSDLMLRNTEQFWRSISDCPVPIIAAVRGLALGGGCELAMHADLIIAGETAKFGQPEVKLGIMPGAGGTQRLMRAVGKYQALKMLLTGKIIPSSQAEMMGLVSEVTPDSDCEKVAFEYAKTISELPVHAIRQIKEVAIAGQDIALESALKLERKAFQLLFDTFDQKEGMRSFIDKRRPQFQDEFHQNKKG